MYRPWGSGDYQEDAIADMSNQRTNRLLQALISGRSFDRSEFDYPVMEYIGELPEQWQILWSSRIAGLPHVWSTCVDIVENTVTFITVD